MTAERKMRTISVPGIPSAEMPLIEIASARPGPLINVVGGLAGTAYAGIGACRALAARLPQILTKGRVRLVPVVDVEGFFQRAARFCPLDGRALAGAFTAARTGSESSATDRIAQAVSEALAGTDIHIDVRGGEHTELHAHWVAVTPGAGQSEALAVEMAAASGADVRVAVNQDDPSSIELGAAGRMADQGRASLILSGGGGVSDVAADAEVLVADLLRVLAALDVIDGTAPDRAAPPRVVGPKIWSHIADSSGLWVPATTPGAQVKAGEALGQIWDYFGEPLHDVKSPLDGCVVAVTTSMAVNAEAGPEGDPWFARTVVVAEAGHGDGHA